MIYIRYRDTPVQHGAAAQRPAAAQAHCPLSSALEHVLLGYRHQFTGETHGIRLTAPLCWRAFDGVLGAYWQAAGEADGRGYYVSANPRISVFFADMTSVCMSGIGAEQPMTRVIYVPAHMPMMTTFSEPIAFSHLDIHLDLAQAVKVLAPVCGRAEARDLLDRPVALPEAEDLEAVARLLVEEIGTPKRHSLFSETLAGSLLAGVMDLKESGQGRNNARLTGAQMRKVTARFEAGGGRRLAVAELADAVNLSESWFSHVFRETTGLTPHQWQLRKRIDLVRRLLVETPFSVAEIALQLEFADQAHLTKVFRQVVGEPPAAWRRAQGRS